jgi:hypothetical protein
MIEMDIEFQAINNCPGYFVSACGQVRGPRRLLKLYKNPGNGYLMFKPGRSRASYYVHRAVAETWLTKGDGNCVNHIDHDKTNNHASNLEWCSHSENMQAFMERYGHYPHQKLSSSDIDKISSLREDGKSQREIAQIAGCSQTHVWRLLRTEPLPNDSTWAQAKEKAPDGALD